MNIKIDNNGHLHIEQPNGWKSQWCPFSNSAEGMEPCGSWCPHFQPHGREVTIIRNEAREKAQGLTLCHGTELHGTITDERAKV